MLAALDTAAFLATLWMLGVIAFQTFAESGRKIVAALMGDSILARPPATARFAVRVNQRSRPQSAMRAQPQLRAAA